MKLTKIQMYTKFFGMFLLLRNVEAQLHNQELDIPLDHNASPEGWSHLIRSNISISHRRVIVGGNLVPSGKYPSFAFNGCGGTLIHDDIVLSAAHCSGAFDGGVWIGGIKNDQSDGEFRYVDFQVKYPEHNGGIGDLMIVKLRSPSTKPIQKLNTERSNPSTANLVTVCGFGDEKTGLSTDQDLLEVTIRAHSDEYCVDSWPGFDPDKQICAGTLAGGKGVCHGDSGGPLYDANKIQIGIVSSGSANCAHPNSPANYVRVSYHMPWITNMICLHSRRKPSTCPSPVILRPSPPVIVIPSPVKSPVKLN